MSILSMIHDVAEGKELEKDSIELQKGIPGSVAIGLFSGAEIALMGCGSSRAKDVCRLKNIYMEKHNANES